MDRGRVARLVAALVARLDCPRCRVPSLRWRGVTWAEDVLYDDREESFQGYTLDCPQCSGAFRFTEAGEMSRRSAISL